MPDFHIRPRALNDLDDIWDYTLDAWGVEQAKAYLRALERAFQTIAVQPELGRPDDEVLPGLRMYPSCKQLIFFFRQGSNVDIVRILHKSMDIESRIEGL